MIEPVSKLCDKLTSKLSDRPSLRRHLIHDVCRDSFSNTKAVYKLESSQSTCSTSEMYMIMENRTVEHPASPTESVLKNSSCWAAKTDLSDQFPTSCLKMNVWKSTPLRQCIIIPVRQVNCNRRSNRLGQEQIKNLLI
jgi:hypothetical protein